MNAYNQTYTDRLIRNSLYIGMQIILFPGHIPLCSSLFKLHSSFLHSGTNYTMLFIISMVLVVVHFAFLVLAFLSLYVTR
jgi:hypothetical protein